jgi:hypothetical protein
MHDAIALERAGVPAAVIVTGQFLHAAEAQRRALGMDALAPVVIQHPLSTLSQEEIEGRAAEAAPQALRIWLGSGS